MRSGYQLGIRSRRRSSTPTGTRCQLVACLRQTAPTALGRKRRHPGNRWQNLDITGTMAAGFADLLAMLADAGDTTADPIPVAIEAPRGLCRVSAGWSTWERTRPGSRWA